MMINSTFCAQCPASGTSQTGSYSCDICNAGYYSTNNDIGNDVGIGNCTLCPKHSTSQYRSNYCLCDIGYYMNMGDTSVCNYCGDGYITPSIGTTDKAICQNLNSSFAFGLLLLPVCLVIFFIYVVNGRGHYIAQLRKEYSIKWLSGLCTNIVNSVEILRTNKNINKNKSIKPHTVLQTIKVWLSIIVMIAVCCVAVVVIFVLVVGRAIFSSIIVARAMENVGYLLTKDTIQAIENLITTIENKMGFMGILLTPLMLFINVISRIRIDFKAIGVSCSGSQAPIKLFLDLFILFIVVIIIDADLNIIISQTISHSCSNYARWYVKSPYKIISVFGAFIVWLITELQPLQTLQYLMTFVTITDFFQYHGIHTYSDACNQASGTAGMDSVIAVLSTICAYIVFAPMFCTISRIMYPGMPAFHTPIYNNNKPISLQSGYQIYKNHYLLVKTNFSANHANSENDDQITGTADSTAKRPSFIHSTDETILSDKMSHKQLKSNTTNILTYLIRLFCSFDLWCLRWFVLLLKHFKNHVSADNSSYNNNNICTNNNSSNISNISNNDISEHNMNDNTNNQNSMNYVNSMRYDNIGSEHNDVNSLAGIFENSTLLQNFPDVTDELESHYELSTTTELITLILLEWGISDKTSPFIVLWRCWAFLPLTQLYYTSVGQYYWYAVFWKYFSFIQVSLSVWTTSSFQHYDMHNRIKLYIPSLLLKRSYLDAIAAVVIPRAVLWQIIPQLTVLTIFTLNTASSPFTTFPNATESTLVYFEHNPFSEAWSVNNKEEQCWVKYLTALYHMTILWKPLKLSFHLFMYGVVLTLVFAPLSFWKVDSSTVVVIVFIVIVNVFCRALPIVIMCGKWIDARDEDFCCLFSENKGFTRNNKVNNSSLENYEENEAHNELLSKQ